MQTLNTGAVLQNGKYKILKVLGQGGFGITYLATHELLGTKVAIKEFFFKQFCNRDEKTSQVIIETSQNIDEVKRFEEKFLKEARIIAKLNHPNIIKIHDVFKENNTAYYVMDYVEGQNLSEKVKIEGSFPEDLAISFIKQAGAALAYVHKQRLNHLDVKPANLMLCNNDGTILLIDFGLSKQYDAVLGNQTSSTPIGFSHGYAPIEQYKEGGVSEFSPQTDIYSLGATMLFLLTGKNPPQAGDILNNGMPDFPSNISTSTRNAIIKAMEVRKNNRPRNVEEFLSMLSKKTESRTEETVYLHNNQVTTTKEDHEWVDLGLPSGTKWATMNIGAKSVADYGDYFAWGETKPKELYEISNLKYRISGSSFRDIAFSKYVTNKEHGNVDGKKELDLDDDAAYVNWGAGWRMPSEEQMNELCEKCKWIRTTIEGKKGYKVVGPNGKSIFLPAAGQKSSFGDAYDVGSKGYYWSRRSGDNFGAAHSLNFSRNLLSYIFFPSIRILCSTDSRYHGQSVRAVHVSE